MATLGIVSNTVTGSATNIKEGDPIIVTHDGRFHCDDVLAVGLLLQIPEYSKSTIVRSRNPSLWKLGNIVVDVGGEYNPHTNRFDHHQKSFNEYYDLNLHTVTKMSSVGMVFKHLGKRILKEGYSVPLKDIDILQEQLYQRIIESVDAIDNGVDITPPGIEPRYTIQTDLSSRVSRLNPNWKTWQDDDLVLAQQFRQAVGVALEEFSSHVVYLRDIWLPARHIVLDALQQRYETHPSGRVIELKIACPYEEHLSLLEQELNLVHSTEENSSSLSVPNGILFVIYPNTSDNSSWRIKTVRKKKRSYEQRLSLPESLRGLRDEEIQKQGFPDVHFVHNAGFLAGSHTREGAHALVDFTLKSANIC